MAKKERGLLTAKEERWLANYIDKLTPYHNKIVERCDFYFYLTVIRLLDNLILDRKLPENWTNPLRRLIDLAKVKDIKAIGEMVSQSAAGNMDVPFLNETGEKAVFLHAYGLIEAKLYEVLTRIENNSKA